MPKLYALFATAISSRATIWIKLIITVVVFGCQQDDKDERSHYQYTGEGINRLDLVRRNNIIISKPDTLSSLSVGNGEFAFTVDASGLQTFYEDYENGISLGTQTQWAWHSIPTVTPFSIKDVMENFKTSNGQEVPYPVQHANGPRSEATRWLRANPHRLHLGIIGLEITKQNGERIRLDDLNNLNQSLDLWTGTITTQYEIDGEPVKIELIALQNADGIAAKITSPLADNGRLKVIIRFPYGNDCHTCPGYDFSKTQKHTTTLVSQTDELTILERKLDSTLFYVAIEPKNGEVKEGLVSHSYSVMPDDDSFSFSVQFLKTNAPVITDFEKARKVNDWAWEDFWVQGGAIDFGGCTDPRAKELERRVVLSQYLTKIQCAGSLPPQETGLTMNSWYGKFHLEMHWWHGVHFALWNRLNLLEKSMTYYSKIENKAKQTAAYQHYAGARWPKMTDPLGRESPSSIGAFIAWQQPHPIYLAELFNRQNSTYFLPLYKQMVFETADFMANFSQHDKKDNRYHLYSPIIPAQETFRSTDTRDPVFETLYWKRMLNVAQRWRKQAGLPVKEKWATVESQFASIPQSAQQYLPVSNADHYSDLQLKHDHPMVLGVIGMLPWNNEIDTAKASRTLDDVIKEWDWGSTWGWDYPMMAMAAARLGKPEEAINLLLMDTQKNTYLLNGHNYQDKNLRLYLPGNGGLLTAVAMMAAGWDGSKGKAPGFPKNDKWNITWENLHPMP